MDEPASDSIFYRRTYCRTYRCCSTRDWMHGPRAASLATCLATLVAVAGAKKQQHMAYRNNMACDTGPGPPGAFKRP